MTPATTANPFTGVAQTPYIADQGGLADAYQQKQAQDAAQKTAGELYDIGVEDTHIANRAIDFAMDASFQEDPDWKPEGMWVADQMEQAGVPLAYFDQLYNAGSEAQFYARMQRFRDAAERMEAAAANGWKGIGIFMGASMTDPIGFGIDAVGSIAGIGLVKKFGKVNDLRKMANRTYAGAVLGAGASSAAIGAASNYGNPNYTATDLVTDFALGATFGAVLDARSYWMSRSEAVQLHNGVQDAVRRQASQPVQLTPQEVTARAQAASQQLEALRVELRDAVRATETPPVTQAAPAAPAAPKPKAEDRLTAAEAALREAGVVSKDGLAKALSVSKKQADTLIRQLESRGVLSKPDAAGKRAINPPTESGGASTPDPAQPPTPAPVPARSIADDPNATEADLLAALPEPQRAPFQARFAALARDLEQLTAGPEPDATAGSPSAPSILQNLKTWLSSPFGQDTLSAARASGPKVEGQDFPRLDVTERTRAGGDTRQVIQDEASNNDWQTGKWLTARKWFLGGSIATILRNSDRAEVRALGRLLTADDVMATDYSGREITNRASVDDWRVIFKKRLFVPFRREMETALAEVLKTGDRIFSQDARRQVFDRVGRAVRGLPESDPVIMQMAATVRKGLDDALDLAVKAGVKGAELIKKADNYLPRIPRRNVYQFLLKRLGSQAAVDETMVKLISEAIRKGRLAEDEPIDEAIIERVATAYSRRFLENQTAKVGENYQLSVSAFDDLNDLLDSMVAAKSIDQGGAQAIRKMFAYKDQVGGPNAPRSDRFMTRLVLDETASIQLDDGSTLSFLDLLENDVEFLAERYMAEMSGKAAFAKMGLDHAELKNAIEDMKSQHILQNPREIEALQILVNGTLGLPVSNYDGWTPIIRSVMGINFVQKMSSVFYSMLAEVGALLAAASLRGSMKQFPMIQAIIKQVKDGTAPDQLGRELAAIVEPGTSLITNPVSLRADDIGPYGEFSNPLAHKADSWLAGLQRATAIFGGSGSGQDALQIAMSRSFAQQWSDWAHGLQELTPAYRNRLLSYGMTEVGIDRMLDHLKNNAVRDGDVLKEMRLDLMPDDLRDEVAVMFHRSVRHVIQEQDLGATYPWMTNQWVRMFTQFMQYPIIAMNRKTLYSLSRMDMTAGTTFMYGTAFAALGVAGRAYIQHPSDSESRNKLLGDPAQLAKSAFAATGESSLIPMLVDSTLQYFIKEDPFFSNFHRASSGASDIIMGNPTVNLANNLFRAAGIPSTMLRTDRELSKEEMNALFALLPLNSAVGIQRYLRWQANRFPSDRELQEE